MEIREIEAFLVLAEELHFGRAAERLGVSPGRVSQLLTALERRLGRRLVLRSSRTVELSAAGEQFLADAKTGYRQLEQAIAATRAAARRKAGVLRLGTSVWLDPATGTDLAEAFEHRHPGWRAQRVIVRPADLFGPLLDGSVDLFVLPLPGPPESIPSPPGTEIGPVLARHERTLFVAADHPLAGRTAVTAADMAGHKLAPLRDHLPARRPEGYLPAAWSSSRGDDDPAERASEPHDAFDLVLRRRLAFLASTGILDLFRGTDVIRIPVTGLPAMHTVLAYRTGPRDQLTTAFLAMAAEFANAASHAQAH
jgi:DNA-binding transcriptional LysR family regulator